MRPDLEVVDVKQDKSFKAWAHGYPYRTVRWHFHPEYEVHLITTTTGRAFVGDHIGTFAPGNLVMTGPNLPHNWISDVAPGTQIPQRCIVVQFSANFIERLVALFPEMRFLTTMLAASRRGIEFSPETGRAALPLLAELIEAQGVRRIELFIAMLGLLGRSSGGRQLASVGYEPNPVQYMSQPLNHVIDHIRRNLTGELPEAELAELSGYSVTAFSRAFRRHTGFTFVKYVNRLRINHACDLLMHGDASVSEICFAVGFNNLSNFNRQFLTEKGLPPSAFRACHRQNERLAPVAAVAARNRPAGIGAPVT